MLPGVSGSPSLFRLVNLNNLKIEINIPDKNINDIEKGQKAIIEVDNAPGQKFWGVVSFVSPEAEPYSGMFPCHIKLENSKGILKPNQFARVSVIINIATDVIIVPQTSLINSQFIFVVKNNIALKKSVKTGISNNNMIEIDNAGINAGDEVVTKGNVGLRDQSKIIIHRK